MAIICHCEGVRERTIVKAVHRGAVLREQVAEACGAGSGCGGCHAAIDELIARHAPVRQPALAGPLRLVARAG